MRPPRIVSIRLPVPRPAIMCPFKIAIITFRHLVTTATKTFVDRPSQCTTMTLIANMNMRLYVLEETIVTRARTWVTTVNPVPHVTSLTTIHTCTSAHLLIDTTVARRSMFTTRKGKETDLFPDDPSTILILKP